MIRGMRESPHAPWRACLLALGLLLGCATPAPEPPPPAPPPEPPRARPAAPPPRPTQAAAWTVDVSGDACVARATGADLAFSLRVTEGDTMGLRLSSTSGRRLPRGGPAPAVFSGTGGGWRADLAASGNDLMASVALDETTLGWAAALLGGGVLDVGGARLGLPLLRVPNAGAEGQRFFACARARNAGAAKAAAGP